MEIKIQHKDNFVEFSELKWFEPDIEVQIKISVQSNEFCGVTIFGCYYDDFEKFALELESVYNFKSSKAVLEDMYNDSYISFEGNYLGHITVNGILYFMDQSVKFRFTADQTSLIEFIKKWRSFR